MGTQLCNHEIRSANLHRSPAEEFLAIDEYVRAYERQWVTVAQLCLRVKQAELWKYGDFHSWEDWINKAAPKSARTIFYHVGLFKDLSSDFTPDELATMPPETAKVLRRLSPSTRRDPRIREAANGRKRGFIEAVQQTHPEELVECVEEIKLSLEASFASIFHEVVESMRLLEDDMQMSYERCIELAFIAWSHEAWGEPEAGITNLARARQLREIK